MTKLRRRWLEAGLAAGLALASGWLLWAARSGAQEANAILVERPGQQSLERVAIRVFEGEPYVSAREAARLVDASLHWRPEVRKLVLRTLKHTLKLTVDNRFVVLDESDVFQLTAPVRQSSGEIFVPLTVFPAVLSGRFVPQARLARGRLLLVADEPDAGPPEIVVEGPITRLVLPSTRPLEAAIVSARESRFTVRIPGAHLTPLPGDTLGAKGLIRRVRFAREPGTLWMEVRFSPETAGYRLRAGSSRDRLELETSRAPAPGGFVELESELIEGQAHALRVLVLDPGHGGSDSGFVAAPGVREKDLTLALAREVREELSRLLPDLQVILTRERDETLDPPLRVEIANRAHADLYVSLHLDGFAGTRLGGATAYVPPPLGVDVESFLGGEDTGALGRPRARPVQLVGWQRAAGRHHAEARSVAELMLASLAADRWGPTRMRFAPTYVTTGADCPALLLECATLSSATARQALTTRDGIRELGQAVARALDRYAEGGAQP